MSDDEPKRKGVAGMSVPKLVWVLRLANFLNGLLLIIIAGTTLQDTAGIKNVPLILSCIYVIFFAFLLVCFECHCRAFNKIVYHNFGFMFNWVGRCVFLFMTGSLAFGFGTYGIIAGCVTVLNVIFNVYVVQTNDFYKDRLEDDAIEMRNRAKTGGEQKEREEKAKAKEEKEKEKSKNKDDDPPKPYKSAWDDDEEKGMAGTHKDETEKQEKKESSGDSVKDEKQRRKEEKELEKQRKKEEKERIKEEKDRAKREKDEERQRAKEAKKERTDGSSSPKAAEASSSSSSSSPSPEPSSPKQGILEVLKMPSGEWTKYADPKSGTFYYYNAYTKETRWEMPTRWVHFKLQIMF